MGYIEHTTLALIALHSSWIIQILGLKSVSSILENFNTQHFHFIFIFYLNSRGIHYQSTLFTDK